MSAVNHPDHYAKGRKYEPIDVIVDWHLDFCIGNVLKYISRAGRKGSIVEDLKKARWYLDKEIELAEMPLTEDVEKAVATYSVGEENDSNKEIEQLADELFDEEKPVDIPKVLALRKAGWSQAKIADEMRCTQGRISQILRKNKEEL